MQFRIGEVNIVCTDLERSLRFYRDVLGFKEVEREGSGLRMRCGDRIFLLIPMARATAEANEYPADATFSVDLLVDDIEEAVRHLKSHGVHFDLEPGLCHTYAIIRDPDGLVLEVIPEDSPSEVD